jgi:hypothetical protein
MLFAKMYAIPWPYLMLALVVIGALVWLISQVSESRNDPQR